MSQIAKSKGENIEIHITHTHTYTYKKTVKHRNESVKPMRVPWKEIDYFKGFFFDLKACNTGWNMAGFQNSA